MIPRSLIDSTGISGSGRFSMTARTADSSIVFSATSVITALLHPFECQRDALADANAHGRKRQLPAVTPQLLGRGQRQPRAGHAERVAESDRAAVGIHLFRIIGETELTKYGERLRSEGFVEFDHIEIRDLHPEPVRQFLGRWSRANAHDPWWDARDGGAEHAGARR